MSSGPPPIPSVVRAIASSGCGGLRRAGYEVGVRCGDLAVVVRVSQIPGRNYFTYWLIHLRDGKAIPSDEWHNFHTYWVVVDNVERLSDAQKLAIVKCLTKGETT